MGSSRRHHTDTTGLVGALAKMGPHLAVLAAARDRARTAVAAGSEVLVRALDGTAVDHDRAVVVALMLAGCGVVETAKLAALFFLTEKLDGRRRRLGHQRVRHGDAFHKRGHGHVRVVDKGMRIALTHQMRGELEDRPSNGHVSFLRVLPVLDEPASKKSFCCVGAVQRSTGVWA